MRARKRVHMIGMGGIGMSGIAKIYLAMGYYVQGSDVKKNEVLVELEKLGAKILVGHDANHVQEVDFVVYSSSIFENHVERLRAQEKKISILHRSEALAGICEGKKTIAVTGTHGKTTTTSLIGMILKDAGRDPSIVVGGLVASFGGNACFGKGPEIVIEADESDSSFLNFSPEIEVITNIEEDHMEHFLTLANVEKAYQTFLKRMPKNGRWYGCVDDPGVLRLAEHRIRSLVPYSLTKSESGLYATDIIECPNGRRGISFVAWNGPQRLGLVQMKIIGCHNALNALAAIGVSLEIGIDFQIIQQALFKFEGTGRRFDVKYEDKDLLLVDDYAHHPTEIKKTLMAARALSKKRIVALFQPHRYSRTEALLKEFGGSFFDADKLIVTDIYAASEPKRPGVNGVRVCEAAKEAGHKDATFVERMKVTEFVRDEIKPGDLVIAIGAGDINLVASELATFFRQAHAPLIVKKKVGANPFKDIQGRIFKNEALAKHTTLKVGGAADFWLEPEDNEDLKKILRICRTQEVPFYFFGAGSNVLPPDEGIRGAVIHFASAYYKLLKIEGGQVVARSGVPNTLFIQYALENGFGEFEFLSGIPGCIGGSIAMNAGSHGQSVSSIIKSIEAVNFDASTRVLARNEIPFRYRNCGLEQMVITEATFVLPVADKRKVQTKLEEYRDYRLKTQELHYPSAGCMFKNPQSVCQSSGKLIDDAGLKGRRIGNAQVSMKHANFIVNLGGATAEDMKRLIEEVRKTVYDKFNVKLETEVKIL